MRVKALAKVGSNLDFGGTLKRRKSFCGYI